LAAVVVIVLVAGVWAQDSSGNPDGMTGHDSTYMPPDGTSGGMGGPGSDGTHGDEWVNDFHDKERELGINVTSGQIGISGEERNSDEDAAKDKVEFTFEVRNNSDSDCMRLKMDYTYDGDDWDLNTNMEIQLIAIHEFSESTMNPGFQGDEDTIINTRSKMEWGNWEDKTGENDTYYTYSASADWENVRLTVYFTDTAAELPDGKQINANEFKFDLELSGWYYVGSGTRLAICMAVKTDYDLRTEVDATTGDTVQLSVDSASGLTSGFFNWESFVYVGSDRNETADIIVTTWDGNYCFTIDTTTQADHMYWDPYMGVTAVASEYEENTGGDAASVQSVVLAVCLLILALLFQ